VRRVVECEIKVFQDLGEPTYTQRQHADRTTKNTTCQKLSMSSINPWVISLTFFKHAKATVVGKNLLKEAMAETARSRYLVSPVTRQA
jgi:hypothetical protein